MNDHTQTSPSTTARPNVTTKVTVRDSEVVASGTIITTTSDGLTIEASGLVYEIVFDDGAEEQGGSTKQISDKKIRIQLSKFTNPLGTSLHSLEIGTISGFKLWLSLFIEAIRTDVKVVSYTIFLGGEVGK